MDKIEKLLTRGVDKIYPSKKELEKVLRSGKKIRLYQGFDPTGTQLHIGHAVGFRKLREFQDLGHEVIFLIGDGTGQAGDPSGKKTARDKFFTKDELRKNGKDYVMQASKIVRFDSENPVKLLYNSDWLNKLDLVKILDIAGHFSLQQMLERDLYQERLKSGTNLSLREFLYPLLQGWDSVAMAVDLEMGGTDQTFNMLAGRKLVREYLKKEKFVLTVPLLTDSKGNKIGKSEGNVIALTDKPSDFFAKVMSLGDDAIIPCFELLTDTPLDEINKYKAEMSNGQNPMKYKSLLAFELTGWLNNEKDAVIARNEFENTYQKGNVPNTLPEIRLAKGDRLVDIISNVVKSRSEAKRLIFQGAVEMGGKAVTDGSILPANNSVLKIGKNKFFKLRQK